MPSRRCMDEARFNVIIYIVSDFSTEIFLTLVMWIFENFIKQNIQKLENGNVLTTNFLPINEYINKIINFNGGKNA